MLYSYYLIHFEVNTSELCVLEGFQRLEKRSLVRRAYVLMSLILMHIKPTVLHELEYEPFCKAVKYIYDSWLRLDEIEEDIVQVLCTAVRLRIDGLMHLIQH